MIVAFWYLLSCVFFLLGGLYSYIPYFALLRFIGRPIEAPDLLLGLVIRLFIWGSGITFQALVFGPAYSVMTLVLSFLFADYAFEPLETKID